jgi:hypothetical protein
MPVGDSRSHYLANDSDGQASCLAGLVKTTRDPFLESPVTIKIVMQSIALLFVGVLVGCENTSLTKAGIERAKNQSTSASGDNQSVARHQMGVQSAPRQNEPNVQSANSSLSGVQPFRPLPPIQFNNHIISNFNLNRVAVSPAGQDWCGDSIRLNVKVSPREKNPLSREPPAPQGRFRERDVRDFTRNVYLQALKVCPSAEIGVFRFAFPDGSEQFFRFNDGSLGGLLEVTREVAIQPIRGHVLQVSDARQFFGGRTLLLRRNPAFGPMLGLNDNANQGVRLSTSYSVYFGSDGISHWRGGVRWFSTTWKIEANRLCFRDVGFDPVVCFALATDSLTKDTLLIPHYAAQRHAPVLVVGLFDGDVQGLAQTGGRFEWQRKTSQVKMFGREISKEELERASRSITNYMFDTARRKEDAARGSSAFTGVYID